MKTIRNKHLYSIIRTDDITSEGETIFKFATWDEYGRQTNAGEVCANSIVEAQRKIFND